MMKGFFRRRESGRIFTTCLGEINSIEEAYDLLWEWGLDEDEGSLGFYDPNEPVQVALCKGRHDIQEAKDGSVFGQELPASDPVEVEMQAYEWACAYDKGTQVYLYVTGLTMALVAALNACRLRGLQVTLYHYDRDTGSYFPQTVL